MRTLPEWKERIDSELTRVYAEFQETADAIDPQYARLLADMNHFIARGGKRLRPYLAYLLSVGLGGEDEASILEVGVVLELLHNFLLIHDDIIDKDLTRYGGPNLSGVYTKKLGDRPRGDAVALLAGDTTLAMGLQVLARSSMPEATRLTLTQLLNSTLFMVCGGEFSDSFTACLQRGKMTTEQILSTYIHKTALYSFDIPMQAGALLAGKSDLSTDILAVALPLGTAYQLRDDYLGVYGDEQMTGKTTDGDIREGKQTYMYTLAYQRASRKGKRFLDQIYGSSTLNQIEARMAREIISATGAPRQVELLIRSYTELATRNLARIRLTSEVAERLQRFITESIDRSH